MMGASTSCGGGIDTRKRLPSGVTAHGTGGVRKQPDRGAGLEARGRWRDLDGHRHAGERRSENHLAPIIAPHGRVTAVAGDLCLDGNRESGEPGGVNDAM